MPPEKLRILFIHGDWPNQFAVLHKYFRDSGIADSWFLISERQRHYHQSNDREFPANIYGFTPDGENGPNSYYYSGIPERSARSATRVLPAVKDIIVRHSIDVIVAHALLGYTYLLFDEVDIPIVSYVEYPSFRHHQWDPRYPPMDGQRYCDKFDEMINYFAAVKSDLTITPSLYAKRMFPDMMEDKVVAQMEAFNPKPIMQNDTEKAAFAKEPGCVYVGFSANVLSSEKGLEQFVAVSKKLSMLNPAVRYVLIGDPQGPGYCYEYIFLEQRFGKNSSITFRDYLFSKYGVNESLYISVGRLDAPSFSATINAVDFFLYPLQFGSANWGIYELLLRGKIVVASNRCFLPEVITHGENGFLLDYNDIDAWAKLADAIARDLSGYQVIGKNAKEAGRKFHMENTSRDYLEIFTRVVEKRRKAA